MTSTKLFTYGLLAEQSAVMALFSDHPLWAQLVLFLAGHLIASLTLAFMLSIALPKRFNIKRIHAMAVFFSFAFFIPVLGAIGMLLVFAYFRFFQSHGERVEFSSVSVPPFMSEAGHVAPGMGEGGAWSRLRTVDLLREVRLRALLAVGSGSGRNTSRLLQMATGDSDDEIRLLAFNLYDRREKVIGASISSALHELKETVDEHEQVLLYKKLAFSYWEMVFNGMANSELALFFVAQALDYAERALKQERTDSSLFVLIGRLYLWKGDMSQAERYINLALEHGAHRDRVVPYLAEFAYNRRDFAALRSLFQVDPLLRYKPGIGPVVKYWMGQGYA
jgi:tetratricopeptide (TPR) repeat protein